MGVRYALALAAVVLAVSVVGSHAASYDHESTLGVNVKDEIKMLFSEWMQKFEKTYETVEEMEFRLKTWGANHLRILKHNLSGDKSFTMAMNQFGDMTPEEFNKRKGLKVDMSMLSTSNVETMEYDISKAPKALDWRTKGAVTAVKNQGACGSCWSFSATGALEGANFLSSGKLVSLSEQELVSCSDAEGNMGCNGGLMDNAFKWIEKDNKGLASEDDYPYRSGNGDVPACENNHKNVVDVKTFTDVEANSPTALLDAVIKQPVSIAIEADMSAFQFYNSGVIKKGSCGTNLDHGVLLVGYGTENDTDYWLVKNSWSTSWGDEGYVKIERNMKTKGPGTCGIQMKASYPTATKEVPTAPSN